MPSEQASVQLNEFVEREEDVSSNAVNQVTAVLDILIANSSDNRVVQDNFLNVADNILQRDDEVIAEAQEIGNASARMNSTNGTIVCLCDHLTSFTILLNVNPPPIPPMDNS